jgi:hypothetical protein
MRKYEITMMNGDIFDLEMDSSPKRFPPSGGWVTGFNKERQAVAVRCENIAYIKCILIK